MNYIKHLTGFFEKVVQDKTLNPTHISLYIALFQCWNCNRFKNPISISRDEVMRISKISSKATYHKCLKNLHSLGYIKYEPSYNPFRGSHVYLFNFSDDLKPQPKSERKPKNEPLIEPASKQASNKSCTSSETSTEQAVVPSINYINNTNNLNIENVSNLNQQAKKFQEINNFQLKNQNSEMQSAFADTNKKQTQDGQQKEKSSAKKEKEEIQNENSAFANSNENQIKNSWQKNSAKKEEKEMPEKIVNEKAKSSYPAFADYNAEHTVTSQQKSSAKKERDEFTVTSSVVEKPKLEKVKSYFQKNNFPEIEAQKFFNYFSSVGWLVGGKTPMIDWQAAAQNWMINAPKFISNPELHNRAKQLNTTTDKDYSEPL
ncbi:transcriptional regulator [uncultured Flavobacterium sp.]|uniref:transcriptional regulator n=1 Tax=uncultured Flavobacterium sp. TaxID=165435 RepID=UPI0030C85137